MLDVDQRGLGLGRTQGGTGRRQVSALVRGAEEPIVADALENGRQHMLPKALDEFRAGQT